MTAADAAGSIIDFDLESEGLPPLSFLERPSLFFSAMAGEEQVLLPSLRDRSWRLALGGRLGLPS